MSVLTNFELLKMCSRTPLAMSTGDDTKVLLLMHRSHDWSGFQALPRFRCSKTASGGSQDALTQQIKARPSVHLTFDEL